MAGRSTLITRGTLGGGRSKVCKCSTNDRPSPFELSLSPNIATNMERKPPKKRNRRSDSNSAAVVAAQNAALGELPPPDHIDFPDTAIPYWSAIMRNRPRDRWNDLDLANAAELAMLHDDMARLRARLRLDGDIGKDGKAHPAHKLLDTAGRRSIALSRMLHVHPEATEGRSRDAGNALKNEREAKQDHDPLIPMLRVVK